MNNVKYTTKIPISIGVDQNGTPIRNSIAETILNWQSENAIAQNKVLKRIDDKLTHVPQQIQSVEIKLEQFGFMHEKAIEVMQALERILRNLEKGKVHLNPGIDHLQEIEKLNRQINLLK